MLRIKYTEVKVSMQVLENASHMVGAVCDSAPTSSALLAVLYPATTLHIVKSILTTGEILFWPRNASWAPRGMHSRTQRTQRLIFSTRRALDNSKIKHINLTHEWSQRSAPEILGPG